MGKGIIIYFQNCITMIKHASENHFHLVDHPLVVTILMREGVFQVTVYFCAKTDLLLDSLKLTCRAMHIPSYVFLPSCIYPFNSHVSLSILLVTLKFHSH